MFDRYIFMSRKHKKANARRLYILGWPEKEICKKLHISKKTLDKWTD